MLQWLLYKDYNSLFISKFRKKAFCTTCFFQIRQVAHRGNVVGKDKTFSAKKVLFISAIHLRLLQIGEVEEMRWPMRHVVKGQRSRQRELVAHVGVVSNAHEVIVPRAGGRHHEVAEEPVGQQHLYLQGTGDNFSGRGDGQWVRASVDPQSTKKIRNTLFLVLQSNEKS